MPCDVRCTDSGWIPAIIQLSWGSQFPSLWPMAIRHWPLLRRQVWPLDTAICLLGTKLPKTLHPEYSSIVTTDKLTCKTRLTSTATATAISLLQKIMLHKLAIIRGIWEHIMSRWTEQEGLALSYNIWSQELLGLNNRHMCLREPLHRLWYLSATGGDRVVVLDLEYERCLFVHWNCTLCLHLVQNTQCFPNWEILQ